MVIADLLSKEAFVADRDIQHNKYVKSRGSIETVLILHTLSNVSVL